MIPIAALNLKVDLANTDSLELLDELDSTLYTHEILAQYFSCLYAELAKRGGSDSKVIGKTVFLEVMFGKGTKIFNPMSSTLASRASSLNESILDTTNCQKDL